MNSETKKTIKPCIDSQSYAPKLFEHLGAKLSAINFDEPIRSWIRGKYYILYRTYSLGEICTVSEIYIWCF